jgi:pSer/pThr/pTyr-binding forkhead associated (FHA) protein
MTHYLELDTSLVPMTGSVTRIGRSLTADVYVEDATVSRRHALIVRQAGDTVLLNDSSRNGTWLNGERIERAVLHDGDTIELGRAQLRFYASEPALVA